jgi:hydrogenase maturation factor
MNKAAGKVKEVVLKRSVLKELAPVLCKEIAKPSVGLDATGCLLSKDCWLLTSVATMEGKGELFVIGTFYRALNNLYVKGIELIGITVSLMLCCGASEAELKVIMRKLCQLCKTCNISILGGETAHSASAREHILTIQALGTKTMDSDSLLLKKQNILNAKIVMAGGAGSAGTLYLLSKRQEELRERFSEAFLQGVKQVEDQLSVMSLMEVAKKYDCIYAHDVSEGGIFTALWEVGEYFNSGIRVDLQQIFLSQQTIEICEFYDLNPYVLFSLGCTLIVTNEAEEMVEAYLEKGIRAAVIGTMTLDGDRILDNGEEVRYLEPYKGDEIYKKCEEKRLHT